MSKHQVSWNPLTYTATVQVEDAEPVAGSTVIGTFEHDAVPDPLGPVDNHVYYHHVRDLLYLKGEQDMQRVTIVKAAGV